MTDATASWAQRGYHFREMEPPDGVISSEAAITAMRSRFDTTGIAPVSSARYGLLSGEYPARQFPDGRREPFVHDTPVWIITMPNRVRPHGRRGFPPPDLPAKSLNVVIDARSGEYIFAFS